MARFRKVDPFGSVIVSRRPRRVATPPPPPEPEPDDFIELSAAEFAAEFDVDVEDVRRQAREGYLAGAHKDDTGAWRIPVRVPDVEPTDGSDDESS